MPRIFTYDLTRLFLGPLSASPRGIDRVDLALAQHFFDADSSANLGILPTPWGTRAYSAQTVRHGLAHLEALWAESRTHRDDHQLTTLVERMHHRPQTAIASQRLSTWSRLPRMLAHLRATGFHLGRPAWRAVPHNAIYLNVGHISLAVPSFQRWLERRPDITCAIMLHDAIPLEYPEMVTPSSVHHHRRMISTAGKHADCLIFTTNHARDSVMAVIHTPGRDNLPNLVRALPLPKAFAEAAEPIAQLIGRPYFLTVSTIEPRKNHRLLIDAWRQLVADMGHAAPHLIIVGSRGWSAEDILSPLADNPELAKHVHDISGLSSPALASLMLGAQAVLCPSLAEGFGLSVLEANALTIPTIASDIPAHREIASPDTILLACDDAAGWLSAIRTLLDHPRKSFRPPIPERFSQKSYCTDIEAFLQDIASSPRSTE